MARIIITILAAGALAVTGGAVLAQTSSQAGSQAKGSASVQANATARQGEQSDSLAPGIALNAELNQSLDSKKAREGDAVVAHTTEAVKSDGKVAIAKGTKLVGHVIRATARSKGDADSALALQFDRAILKDGREMRLQVTIQALASAESAAAVGGDDLQPAGRMGGGAAASSGTAGRGAIGGVGGSTVGGAASGAASTVPRTTQDATTEVNSTVSGATSAAGRAGSGVGTGLNAAGQLTSTSRGVFGLNGISLNANAVNSTEGSVITSAGKNVRLDSGTRMLLVTQAGTSASAQR